MRVAEQPRVWERERQFTTVLDAIASLASLASTLGGISCGVLPARLSSPVEWGETQPDRFGSISGIWVAPPEWMKNHRVGW
jgi:hypothetical protein